MINNHIKSAFRSILKNKLFSLVHITGLSIGLAASFIMLMIAVHEYSYDNYNKNLDRIYRVYVDAPAMGKTYLGAPYMLADEIKRKAPGVDETARVMEIPVSVKIEGKNESFSENKAISADKSLRNIFTIPLISGENNYKPDRNSALISEKAAKKYFAGETPEGKTLQITCGGESYLLNISGVFKDFPETSTLQSDFILPIHIAENYLNKRYAYRGKEPVKQWGFFNFLNVFVLLKENADIEALKKAMPKLSDYEDTQTEIYYRLEAYSNVHLNSGYDNVSPYTVKKETIDSFLAISMLILLMATLNFIILSITRLRDKSRETGIRKVLGAGKKEIISLNLTESVMYAILSLPLTILLVSQLNRHLPEMLNLTISDNYLFDFSILSLFIILTVVSGLVSGLYTALLLSKKSPLIALKSESYTGPKQIRGKQVLLSVQMVILICMMFLSLGVKLQTDYFRKKDLGFTPENLLIVNIAGVMDESKYKSFKSSIAASSFIAGVSAADMLPPLPRTSNWRIPSKDNPEVLISVDRIGIDEDFLETMEIELLDGNNIYSTGSGDTRKLIFNREAVKAFNLGKERYLTNARTEITGTIEDFNYASLNQKIGPLALAVSEARYFNEMIIRYSPGSEKEAVNHAKTMWEEYFPGKNFDFYYMEDKFAQVYKNEYNFSSLITFAAALSIFISCLGLFGLTVYTVRLKMKEIGIRKILGAKLTDIMRVLTKSVLALVLMSSAAGLVIGNYLLTLWLQNFAYRAEILPLHYLLIVFLGFVIVFITMSAYIVKYYYANPVRSIRSE